MLYLVRLANLMYVYSANARKEGKLNVQSGDLVIYRDVSRPFVPGLFMRNTRHLMFRPIIPNVSSHIFSSIAILD